MHGPTAVSHGQSGLVWSTNNRQGISKGTTNAGTTPRRGHEYLARNDGITEGVTRYWECHTQLKNPGDWEVVPSLLIGRDHLPLPKQNSISVDLCSRKVSRAEIAGVGRIPIPFCIPSHDNGPIVSDRCCEELVIVIAPILPKRHQNTAMHQKKTDTWNDSLIWLEECHRWHVVRFWAHARLDKNARSYFRIIAPTDASRTGTKTGHTNGEYLVELLQHTTHKKGVLHCRVRAYSICGCYRYGVLACYRYILMCGALHLTGWKACG